MAAMLNVWSLIIVGFDRSTTRVFLFLRIFSFRFQCRARKWLEREGSPSWKQPCPGAAPPSFSAIYRPVATLTPVSSKAATDTEAISIHRWKWAVWPVILRRNSPSRWLDAAAGDWRWWRSVSVSLMRIRETELTSLPYFVLEIGQMTGRTNLKPNIALLAHWIVNVGTMAHFSRLSHSCGSGQIFERDIARIQVELVGYHHLLIVDDCHCIWRCGVSPSRVLPASVTCLGGFWRVGLTGGS